MNSEISNVVKISPVTVVKTGKQADESVHPSVVKEDTGLSVTMQHPANEELNHVASALKKDDKKKNDSKLDAETVRKAVDQGNALLQTVKRNLQFKVDDATKETVVKIVDSESGEVVRQIPSEEMLAFVKRMKELEGQQGSMLQDRA